MAITRNDIFRAYAGVNETRRKTQDMEAQYKASRTKEDDIADRINAMSLDEQSALARALKDGDYRISASASAAKEVYDKAMSQAQLVAQSFNMKPQDAGYDDWVQNYARQFYDQNIGLGVVSYDQAAEMSKTAAANAEQQKAEAYKSTTADLFAGAFDNPRWKDMVYHIAGQDQKVSSYGQPSYYVSGQNGPQAASWAGGSTQNREQNSGQVQNAQQYPDWFEEYYNNH